MQFSSSSSFVLIAKILIRIEMIKFDDYYIYFVRLRPSMFKTNQIIFMEFLLAQQTLSCFESTIETLKNCETCSKLTKKTSQQRQ